jgi:2Fe-2S ferredoxin
LPTITFQPLGTTVDVKPGTTILQAAEQGNVFLRHTCGGQAMCGTCRCKVLEGASNLSPMARHEQKRLEYLYAAKNARLSCQAQINGNVAVEVPVPTLGL